MIDVTAYLMGDPAARQVRAPTWKEAHRTSKISDDMTKRGRPKGFGRRGVKLVNMRVGDWILAADRRQAENYSRWFRDRGHQARMKRNPDGVTYTVARVR